MATIWNILGMKKFPIWFIYFFSTQGKRQFDYLTGMGKFLGVFVLMILIPSVATERASVKFVFTHFYSDIGEGINSKPYIFLLGNRVWCISSYGKSFLLLFFFLLTELVALKCFYEFLLSDKLYTSIAWSLHSDSQEESSITDSVRLQTCMHCLSL